MEGLTEARGKKGDVLLQTVTTRQWPAARKTLDKSAAQWLKSTDFKAEAGSHALLPGANGALARVIACVDTKEPVWSLAGLPLSLPTGDYQLDNDADLEHAQLVKLGWALGAY